MDCPFLQMDCPFLRRWHARRGGAEPLAFVGVELLESLAALLEILFLPLHEPDEEVGAIVKFGQLPGEIGGRGGGASREHLAYEREVLLALFLTDQRNWLA